MKDMDGLEAARKIKAEFPKVHIVLATAYVNYALEGYKVKTSRFLLKDDLEKTLKECMDDILREIRQEERVVEFGFVRIHQSFLINMKYIERISSYVMILTTGKEISVPKSRYPEVKRQYTLFKGQSDYRNVDTFLLHYGDRGLGERQ